MKNESLQELIVPNQVLEKEHLSKKILPQACPSLANFTVLFLNLQAGKQQQILLESNSKYCWQVTANTAGK